MLLIFAFSTEYRLIYLTFCRTFNLQIHAEGQLICQTSDNSLIERSMAITHQKQVKGLSKSKINIHKMESTPNPLQLL